MVIIHNLEENTEDQIKLKEIEKWQNDKIFDTYININNDFSNCEFFSNWLKN